MTNQLDIIDGIADDISIAQGLLGRPIIPPKRRTSFTRTSASASLLDGSQEYEAGIETKDEGGRRRMVQSSNTWTTSSGELLSDQDDIEDRTFFVQEYNRLAKKHGLRALIPDEQITSYDSIHSSGKPGSWFSRKILRRTSSSQSIKLKNDRQFKHRRSISDLSLRLKSKSDTLKDKDLQELVRLCGLSLLYLPTEYAAGSLAVPTCFRATAQYLVQHAPTARGVFRIPGSHSVVAALYNHYCTMDDDGAIVAGTVRCPTLPEHIRCDVHDVASAFKKFISGLPGGILGSLALFDAFISIQNQLHGVPELTRTKQSKVRARLIALAIATLRSQYRRELICAVFGLLSMIGRIAETTPRENMRGRPLPTSDLMGYGPLGIVFGPLLVGDILENYTMRLANPRGGLVLLPVTPPKSRKERHKKTKTTEDTDTFNTHVDKIKVANGVTEMLITHWRDVVRHMKNLKALKQVRSYKSLNEKASTQPFLRPSASESFALRKPPDWDNSSSPIRKVDRSESPTPVSRASGILEAKANGRSSPQSTESLTVRKQRSRPRPMSSQILSGARSMSILSPTKEEAPADTSPDSILKAPRPEDVSTTLPAQSENGKALSTAIVTETSTKGLAASAGNHIKNIVQRGSKPAPEDGCEIPPSSPDTTYLVKQRRFETQPRRLLGPRQPEPSAPIQRFPEITISRVNSPSGTPPTLGHLRRISASEPGRCFDISLQRSIRQSKSTFVESGFRDTAQGWSTPKDPLARVSTKEDLASLAALAQALEDEPSEAEVKFGILERPVRYARPEPPTRTPPSRQPRAIEGPGYAHLPRYQLNSKKKSLEVPSANLAISTNTQYSKPPFAAGPPMYAGGFSEKEDNFDAQVTPLNSLNSPKRNDESAALGGSIRGSPRGNVKALAARFNTASPTSSSLPSPTKSHFKDASIEVVPGFHSPKEKVVAPYTTNPASPTKSQKSGKSDASLQSIRVAQNDRQGKSTPGKGSPPRRVLRSDLNDPTPLRLVQKSKQEPMASIISSPASASLGKAVNVVSNSPPVDARTMLSSFDGPSISSTITEPMTGSPPHHVHFVRPQTIVAAVNEVDSLLPISDTCLNRVAISPVMSPVLTRSNSILHGEIRALQRQLTGKTEEVRQLKQQVGTRGSLDIGTLSEQLRESKKELQIWKTRAEVAEKQLEMMVKISGRTTSRKGTVTSSSIAVEQSKPSSSKYSEDAAIVRDRIKRSLHGMDGADSYSVSEEAGSSDTVIHEIGHTVTGSEYSIWVERTMSAINSMSA